MERAALLPELTQHSRIQQQHRTTGECVQERVTQAVEIAERHFDTFRVETLTRNERNQFLAALGLKLPLACATLRAPACRVCMLPAIFFDASCQQ